MSRPVNVLLVDDDVWLLEHYTDLLSAAGHQVISAKNAVVAIDLIDKQAPDVIVLDVLLPGATGFSLLHELQSYDDTATVPVIICSGLTDDLSLDDLAPYGVRRLLDKTTMTPDDLLAAVRSVTL